MDKEKKQKISRIVILLFCILLVSGCVTDYYFEVDQVKYKSYFSMVEYKQTNKGEICFYNNKNWSNLPFAPMSSIYFPTDSSKTWFNIEFLREPNIKYSEFSKHIKRSSYLVSRIQFHSEIKNIVNVNIEPIYDGEKLNKLGSYIYTINKVQNEKQLQSFSQDSINTYNDLTIYFVFDYPSSEVKRFFTKKTKWFPKEMTERITITYEVGGKIEKKEYLFDLNWMYVSYWIT